MDQRLSGASVEGLLARVEQMAAAVAAQSARIAELEAATARTAAAGSIPGPAAGQSKLARRSLLRKGLGATAAAALLLVAKEARTADAASRTTVVGPSANYGLAAAPGFADPLNGWLPFINQNYGVIGSVTTSPPFSEREAGVLGLAFSTTGVQGLASTGFGVFGSVNSSGTGVFGGSSSGIGVYANSNGDTGLFATAPRVAAWGRTTGGLGVFGQATNFGGIGVYGAAPAFQNTWAGYFEGNVFVSGRVFTAAGGILSAQRQADGSVRAFYAPDNTEPIVEAFGRATLAGGRAAVPVDPAIAAAAPNGDYLVFLTEEGDAGGLYVAARQKDTFEVRSRSGAGAGSFAYRVAARPGVKAAGRADAQGAGDGSTAKLERRVDQAAPPLPAGTAEEGDTKPPPPAPRPAR